MTTGERMKARRKELGYSAEYIAAELNVSPSTVYRYEKGDIEKIAGDILDPLSKILHTTPAYLMGWEESPSPAPAPAAPAPAPVLPAGLAFKLSRLDAADLDKVEAYTDGLLAQDKYKVVSSAG